MELVIVNILPGMALKVIDIYIHLKCVRACVHVRACVCVCRYRWIEIDMYRFLKLFNLYILSIPGSDTDAHRQLIDTKLPTV